jgi:putative membrane protein
MLEATIPKNDKFAYRLIIGTSVLVFCLIAALPKMYLGIQLPFDPHVFALINAVINSTVSLLLIAGLITVRQRKYETHKRIMLTAMVLSALFLLSYVAHHLFALETSFGGQGPIRYFYFFILITHIILAAIILPFILFTSYQSLSGQFARHRKIARYTFPLWLYVSITGVLVYLFISPYYT